MPLITVRVSIDHFEETMRLTGLYLPTRLFHLTQRRLAFAGTCCHHGVAVTQITADTKVNRSRALVVWYCRVGLDFHELRNDVSIAYPRCKVQSCIAGLVSCVDHLLHESHQSDRLRVVAGLMKRSDLTSANVAADEVFK
jgi:hypothetical protein